MTTAPDGLKQFGGVPVSSDNFAGWWGNDVWFVDFDNGTRADGLGKDMANPQKDLYRAITDSGAGDAIYIRPRTTLGDRGTSATSITPAATEAVNWVIPQTKNHLSIIGTGTNSPLENGVKLEGYTSSTTATVLVYAPYVTFENIGFQADSAAQVHGLLTTQAFAPGTEDGYSCTVNRCNFHVYKPAASQDAALVFDSGRYNQCLNSSFWHNYVGVKLSSGAKVNHGNLIRNCDFWGATGDVDSDIRTADADHVLIDGNRFHHDCPALSAGSYLKYIHVVTAEGLICHNFFASTDASFAADNAPGNMKHCHNFSDQSASFFDE